LSFNKSFKLLAYAGLSASLVGCSSASKWFNGDDDYRTSQAELSKKLETPPNFVLRSVADPLLTAEVAIRSVNEIETLPALKVEGLRVDSNLHQRWLVMENLNASQAWQLAEQFLVRQGFEVDEKRPELGLITTKYLARSEVAPSAQELGRLSQLLNSWRPDLAKGIYDRYSVQLVSEHNKVNLYFYHHMILADSNSDITRWSLRPYEPMMEMLALYRMMLFMGARENVALSQIATSAYYQEIFEAEELAGLTYHAPISQTWDYLQAMQYRASWQVESTNSASHELWVKIPKLSSKNKGFISQLFGRTSQPGLVRISLASVENNSDQTRLTLGVEAGERPLNAEQRRQILEALGLLSD
jgi:outer membrane protein assembly factor BamC